MKITRERLLAVFVFMGFKNAGNWENDKLLRKIPAFKDTLPQDKPEDLQIKDDLDDIMEALDDKEQIEVVAETEKPKVEEQKPAETAEKEKVAETATTNTAETADKSSDSTSAAKEDLPLANTAPKGRGRPKKDKEEKPKKEKPAKAEKPVKAPKEPKANPAKPASPYQKVRPAKTSLYYAGVVFKKHGLEKGVTDEMLADFRALRGKDAGMLDETNLCNAWHFVNGYLGYITPDKLGDAPAGKSGPRETKSDGTPAEASSEKKEEPAVSETA